MPDRVSSDHPSVTTHRVQVVRHGAGRRIEVPAHIPDADVIRLVLDEQVRHAAVTTDPAEETWWILGAYTSPAFARSPEQAEDLLDGWLSAAGISPGSSVHLDVVEPDFLYGLREPGQRVTYQAISPPSNSLSEIARGLDQDDS